MQNCELERVVKTEFAGKSPLRRRGFPLGCSAIEEEEEEEEKEEKKKKENRRRRFRNSICNFLQPFLFPLHYVRIFPLLRSETSSLPIFIFQILSLTLVYVFRQIAGRKKFINTKLPSSP
jgi:hypothetical protein